MKKEEINLTELSDFLKRKIGLFLTMGLLGLVVSSVYTFFIAEPQYSSTTQVLVNQRSGENGSIELNDINTNIQMINTYTELITGPAILDGVQEILGTNMKTEDMAKKIEINSPENTQVFTITVTENSPEQAALTANTIAQTFQVKIAEMMNKIDSVAITYAAAPEPEPVSPIPMVNLAVGILVGLAIGIATAFGQQFVDRTLRDTDFITEDIGWHDLGTIDEVTEDTRQLGKGQAKSREERLSGV